MSAGCFFNKKVKKVSYEHLFLNKTAIFALLKRADVVSASLNNHNYLIISIYGLRCRECHCRDCPCLYLSLFG